MNKIFNLFSKNEDVTKISLIESVCEEAIQKVIHELSNYSNNNFYLTSTEQNALKAGFTIFKERYLHALHYTRELAKNAYEEKAFNKKRISYFNTIMQKYKDDTLTHFPSAANIWILDGIVIEKQIGGIKKLAGLSEKEGYIIDVLNSASSLSLGAENPWLIKADQMEDYFGIRDNMATVYHPGIRHAFVLNKLAQLYPGKQKLDTIKVHIESSGAIVNSIAIESVVAYSEKQGMVNGKILAIDGSWAGGYGSAREATGFGINQQTQKRIEDSIWVDRCLPTPTKKNKERFFTILQEKIREGKIAGIFMEPDIIGDLGVITAEKTVVEELVEICKQQNIPIILDCVQQLGRTGSYWGDYVDHIFSSVSLLVITTGKSASNGQPLAFTLLPQVIADAAYPLTQLTTNQMNCSLLRTVVVAEILKNPKLQDWINKKSLVIEKIASSHNISLGENGLRGKYLNRGIYIGDNEKVKLVQLALFIEDGILVGAFPKTIRYQPMLLELTETNQLVADIICRRINKVLAGDIAAEVVDIYQKMGNISSGLAR